MTVSSTSADPTLDLLHSLVSELLEALPPASTPAEEFLSAQFDAGLAWVHFPRGAGGLGLSPKYQEHVDELLDDAGAPNRRERNPVAYGQGASTFISHGTDEQRARFLKPMFTAEEVWCQLFSEPGAGSDLAGLATTAVRDGDDWIVNGQKVWTTLGHLAQWGLLLARTDPAVPKHEGLTYFFVDMSSPGIEVRPLYEITGEAEFNEVYLTDVRVPDAQRISPVGKGWSTAMTTLMNERASTSVQFSHIDEALRIWEGRADKTSAQAMVLRDELMQVWTRSEVARLTALRANQTRDAGVPGPEASVLKLSFAESNQQICNWCVDALGAEGQLYGSYERVRSDPDDHTPDPVQKIFLRSRANTIEAGSSQIMRNILGERVLGLPAEPRADRGMPWNQVRRQ